MLQILLFYDCSLETISTVWLFEIVTLITLLILQYSFLAIKVILNSSEDCLDLELIMSLYRFCNASTPLRLRSDSNLSSTHLLYWSISLACSCLVEVCIICSSNSVVRLVWSRKRTCNARGMCLPDNMCTIKLGQKSVPVLVWKMLPIAQSTGGMHQF